MATAVANNNATVDVLLTSQDGMNLALNQEVISRGGIVRYSDDDVGYIRASVPVKSLEALSASRNIVTLDSDESLAIDDPRPKTDGHPIFVPPVPPGPSTPPSNAYLPTKDIGAPQFVAAHPTYDGRGIKIGVLDSGVDLLTPELQTAKTIDGQSVRKVVDWVNINDPVTDGDPTWLNMQSVVTVSNHQFSAGGLAYSGVARDGQYRFAVFHEADLGFAYQTPCGGDLNRNGICNELFAVLWDANANVVWVDSNADRSFVNEPGMTDYKIKYDIGIFGADNPATPLRESVPFVVQTDKKNLFVNIGIVAHGHGTGVAGVAAGKGFLGGAFNGSAPEAQIVSVNGSLHSTPSFPLHSLIEGAIYLAKIAKVDIINLSAGQALRLNDGNETTSLAYNRLVERYKVSIFVSAGNSGPGLNTISAPSTGSEVISVGGFIPADTIAQFYGAVQPGIEGVERTASRGPRDDGGFKPNIISPYYTISTLPAWQEGFSFFDPLPSGISWAGGTSFSSPIAAGGAALLLSAAKQFGVSAKPDQLNQAIRSSADFLSEFQAHEQGNGLMNVGEAWKLLQKNIQTEQITSQAPVRTVDSARLITPNIGPGIYEREGWTAGQVGQRTINLIRSSGGAVGKKYNLTWVGNDGTFGSLGSISLPRDIAVPLTVNVSPQTLGAHSAILNVDNPDTDGIDYQIMNTVVAASSLTQANSFTSTVAETADNKNSNTYVRVPSGGRFLRTAVSEVHGEFWLQRYFPFGQVVFTDPLEPSVFNASTSRVLPNPRAGVWETATFQWFFSDPYPATFNVTNSLLAADVSPLLFTIDPATVGQTYGGNFTFTNIYGPFTGGGKGSALGSAYSAHTTLTAGGPQQIYEVQVGSGATRITTRINHATDPNADIDLYLFNCTTGTCVLAGQSTSPTANELITVDNPTPGTWIVLVDPFSVPSGSTELDYMDVFLNPAFGEVVVNDANALHPVGDMWTRSANATALSAPVQGRYLKGFVRVEAEGFELVSADFDLRNVTH